MSARQILPVALAVKAAAELNEQPTEHEHYLHALRAWLSQQCTFKSRTDDDFLIAFLRASKFSLEQTKVRLECFYRYRATLPELFDNRDINDPKMEFIVKSGALVYLPETIGIDGPRVLMLRTAYFDMLQHNLVDAFRALFIAVDLLLYEDYHSQIAGFTIIIDFANCSKAVWADFNLSLMLKLLDILNKHIFPARFKALHIINTPAIFEKLYLLIKSAISDKLKTRFIVHGQTDEGLYASIPRHILPKEYGGTHEVKSMQEDIYKRLLAKADILAGESAYGLLDTCGKTSIKSCGNSYGINGSFRKLNID